MTAERLSLDIDGQRFTQWKAGSVRTSLEAVAPAFSFTIATDGKTTPLGETLRVGKPCTISLGDDLILRCPGTQRASGLNDKAKPSFV